MSLFLYPWGLLALLGVPAVLALHLFRRRFRPRVVSALFLWQAEDRTSFAGRRRDRLRQSASLWAELLAALLLALLIAGFQWPGAGQARHAVFIIDGSASMSAGLDGETALDRAKEAIERQVDALPRGSRVSLLRSGPRPTVIAGPAAWPADALDAAANMKASERDHSLDPSLTLGRQFAEGKTLSLITDRFEPDRYGTDIDLIAVGDPLPNVGWTHASWERSASQAGGVIEATVRNFSNRRVVKQVSVLNGESEFESRALTLEASAEQSLRFVVDPSIERLRLRLDEDAFGQDNDAYLVRPPSRTVAVASTLEVEESRLLGLGEDDRASSLERWVGSLEDVRVTNSVSLADLVLCRGEKSLGRSWSLLFREPMGEERTDLVGPFVLDRTHSLLEGVTLEGLIWSCSKDGVLQGVPLISAGDRTLMTETQRGRRRIFALDFDPARSSWQRSPDWPIFLANLIEACRDALPGPRETNRLLGEELVYLSREPSREDNTVGRGDLQPYRLVGEREAFEFEGVGRVHVESPHEPGFYELTQGGRTLCLAAWSFIDPAESDLGDCSEGRRESSEEIDRIEASLLPSDLLLASLIFVLLILDWYVLNRGARTRERRAA